MSQVNKQCFKKLSVAIILSLILNTLPFYSYTAYPKPVGKGRNSASYKVNVKDIRYWSHRGYTRVVIDLDRKARIDKKHLLDPNSIYLDIYNARIDAGLKKGTIPVSDGILKQLKVSQHPANRVRIVLDLAGPIVYKVFPLADPHRIVIDITPMVSIATDDGIETIVIDPGHGGKDPGAIGRRGLTEKDVVLDIAKRLKILIEKRLNKKVLLTREDDTFIPLEERTAFANTNNADLFISIHTNASPRRYLKGVETYLLDLSSDPHAMETAARENMGTISSMSDLEMILKDLMFSLKKEESLVLAHLVQDSIVGTLLPRYSDVVDLGVKQAPFYVLIGANMPSILAEVSFISNPTEEKRLRNADYRQKIAEGLLQAVRKYTSSTKMASTPSPAGIP